MRHGGTAGRGHLPPGGEVTSPRGRGGLPPGGEVNPAAGAPAQTCLNNGGAPAGGRGSEMEASVGAWVEVFMVREMTLGVDAGGAVWYRRRWRGWR